MTCYSGDGLQDYRIKKNLVSLLPEINSLAMFDYSSGPLREKLNF